MEVATAKETEIQSRYENKQVSCQKIEGDTVLIQSDSKASERENKILEHKIDCVQMLVNVLYGCRDQLIDLRRNPSSSRYLAYESPFLKIVQPVEKHPKDQN